MAADFFCDTSGFFALLNADDPAHLRACEFMRRAEQERRRAVTSSWVVGETCTLLIARKRAHLVAKYLDYMRPSRSLHCVHPDEIHFAVTAAFLRKNLERGYSFVDCSSMVLIRELHIRAVFTSDHHFAEAGLTAELLRS